MSTELFLLFERLANLLRSESRGQGGALSLQPVQLEALYYLSNCNRYSDTPLAVAEYLGLTKGTVSQTLKVLESRGLVEKKKDIVDKRLVHLVLSDAGRDFIEATIPPEGFLSAIQSMPAEMRDELSEGLKQLLASYQKYSGRRGFGVCRNCRYNESRNGEFICGLTKDALAEEETLKLCREFE